MPYRDTVALEHSMKSRHTAQRTAAFEGVILWREMRSERRMGKPVAYFRSDLLREPASV